MAVESRSLLERISARIAEAQPSTRNPLGVRQDVLSSDDEGDDSPRLPPCSHRLDLSDSEEEKSSLQFGCKQEPSKSSVWRSKPDSRKKNHFSFPEEKPRSTVNILDSSDEEFENFLIQLKTPKQPPKKPLDKQSSVKSFIVDDDDDDDDDFDAMISKGGRGNENGRNGGKTSVLVSSSSQKAMGSSQWNDSPVFISDSDEDSIVIRSTWTDRHRTNRNPKDKGQRAKSVLTKNVQENHPEPPNHKSSARPEALIRPEPLACTPVSSDEEFECLMDRIKNRTKNQTPGSIASKGKPKSFLTEPPKAPCLDLTNKKKNETKPKPPSWTEASKSPHIIPDKAVKTPHPGDTGVPCKVKDCFLSDLSRPSCPYVKEFKQKKHELTSRLYRLYNSTVFDEQLPADLEILWNKKMRKTAGYCVTGQRKVPSIQRYARIELSEKVCDCADRLRDTLIHEICHAATWLINGVRDGHGQYWRFYARKATLVHPELPMVTRCHTYEINYKFTYECSRCKNTIGRHSKSLDTERFVCALCKGKLVLQGATRKDGSPANTQLTPFARFVKENYGSAKKEMSGMSHAEIMRKLSADFSTKTKISD